MKKTYIILAIGLLISTSLFAKGNQENNSTDEANLAFPVERSSTLPNLEGRTIIAVTANDYVPLNFVDPNNGQAIGFEYDLTNTIAYLLNAKVDWKVSSWDTMIHAVKEGQFDVGMDGITITKERKKEIDFSIPYLRSQQVLVVRKDENRFDDADDFARDPSLIIGTQPGTTQFYTAVYDILNGDEYNPRISLFDNFSLVVQALLTEDVDLILMDKVSAEGYIGANGGKVKILDDPMGNEEFGFIFTPKSDLTEAFNEAIKYLDQQGIIKKLENKWFYEYQIQN